LEILCQISHYSETIILIFKQLSSHVSYDLKLSMKDSVTIIKLLHDMRTVVNNVNSNNNNIYSFEFKKCEIQCSWKNNNDNNIHQEQQ